MYIVEGVMQYRRNSDGTLVDMNGVLYDNQMKPLQSDGQLTFDMNMNITNEVETYQYGGDGGVYDLESKKFVATENEEKVQDAMELLKDKNFNPNNFLGALSENTELLLHQLLSMQSNAKPLKKGGVSIGFLCDTLISATRCKFSQDENTLFDAITAAISTRPEDDTYMIKVDDVLEYYPYTGTYLNKIFAKATDSITEKNIEVEYIQNDKKCIFRMPWHNGAIYNKPNDKNGVYESGYVAFKPTPLFKLLCISSQQLHGAHYKIGVSSQFRGYTRSLFYELESKKNYREYPGAKPGVFYWSVEQCREYFRLSETYPARNITAKIFSVAKEKFDKAKDLDFTFDFKVEIDKHNRTTGYTFYVKDLKSINAIESTDALNSQDDEEYKQMSEYLLLQGMSFDDTASMKILKSYRENNRDNVFLLNAISMVFSNPKVIDKVSYLCTVMEKGLIPQQNQIPSSTQSYNQFPQNQYDFEMLENEFLSN